MYSTLSVCQTIITNQQQWVTANTTRTRTFNVRKLIHFTTVLTCRPTTQCRCMSTHVWHRGSWQKKSETLLALLMLRFILVTLNIGGVMAKVSFGLSPMQKDPPQGSPGVQKFGRLHFHVLRPRINQNMQQNQFWQANTTGQLFVKSRTTLKQSLNCFTDKIYSH